MFKKRENVVEIEEGNLLSPKFDNDGLIPVITMCSKTKEILMHGCFVLVDPFKKNNDKIRFLNKLIKEFRNKNKYLILINFNNFKLKKNFKLLKSITGSHSRSIKIYKIL